MILDHVLQVVTFFTRYNQSGFPPKIKRSESLLDPHQWTVYRFDGLVMTSEPPPLLGSPTSLKIGNIVNLLTVSSDQGIGFHRSCSWSRPVWALNRAHLSVHIYVLNQLIDVLRQLNSFWISEPWCHLAYVLVPTWNLVLKFEWRPELCSLRCKTLWHVHLSNVTCNTRSRYHIVLQSSQWSVVHRTAFIRNLVRSMIQQVYLTVV